MFLSTFFNAYGTQALRPFSSKWVALGVINTFDPIIFAFHVVGLFLWAFGYHPGYTFLTIYAILVFYYIYRFIMKHRVKRAVENIVPDATDIIMLRQ